MYKECSERASFSSLFCYDRVKPKRQHRTSPAWGIVWRPYGSHGLNKTHDVDVDDDDDADDEDNNDTFREMELYMCY